MKIIVIKLGSQVLHNGNEFNFLLIKNLIQLVNEYLKQNIYFVIVSSGAVSVGKTLCVLNQKGKLTFTQKKQIYAGIGQVELMNFYQKYFEKYKIRTAQALFTRRDFADKDRYASMKLVLENLLFSGVVPIINENDVVSPEELDFSDNDQLSAYVAAMLNAEKLILVSNVDGLFTDLPEKGGKLISKVSAISKTIENYVSFKKSKSGTGGMFSKIQTAKFMMGLGIPVHIINGNDSVALKKVLLGKSVGTLFEAKTKKNINNLRRWLKMGAVAQGKIIVSNFIANLLQQGRRSSVLSIGVETVLKSFKKGDIVEVLDQQEKVIGIGVAKISSSSFKAKDNLGGEQISKIVIHTNYFINL